MSTSFSANQYQDAFYSKKLQNWEVPRLYPEQPRRLTGFTKNIIACDRGHLFEGVPRSRKNPWGDFVGTWDLPMRIPGNCARVYTARTSHAQDQLRHNADDAHYVMRGGLKNSKRQNLDHAYASSNPPMESGADPAPGPGTPDRKSEPCGMFPAINGAMPATPPLNAQAPPPQVFTPVGSNKIPTPGLGTPQPNLGRSPTPPEKSPVVACTEDIVAL